MSSLWAVSQHIMPVTVLSGFLWSGKTTLLKRILEQRDGQKVAVLVNDMADLNIDASLIRHEVALEGTEEKLIEMSNGCICCTLREDLLIAVERLCKEWTYDALIIESSGISEPIPVAQTFSYKDPDTGIDLSQYARLDTLVTIVDGAQLLEHVQGDTTLQDLDMEAGEGDTRTLAELLIDQVECCDVLLLNKTDLLDAESLDRVRRLLRTLQPNAKYIETTYADVAFDDIVNTRLFSLEDAEQSAGWIKELEMGHQAHTPETEEYGVSSFVYRSHRPFHPQRLWKLLHSQRPGVIRAKWFLWLATRPDSALLYSQAGKSIRVQNGPRWLASLTYQELEAMWLMEERARHQDKPHKDRVTELVCIGTHVDAEAISQLLDDACMSASEERTNDTPDPFEDVLSPVGDAYAT